MGARQGTLSGEAKTKGISDLRALKFPRAMWPTDEAGLPKSTLQRRASRAQKARVDLGAKAAALTISERLNFAENTT
jgi:hypothetical protein